MGRKSSAKGLTLLSPRMFKLERDFRSAVHTQSPCQPNKTESSSGSSPFEGASSWTLFIQISSHTASWEENSLPGSSSEREPCVLGCTSLDGVAASIIGVGREGMGLVQCDWLLLFLLNIRCSWGSASSFAICPIGPFPETLKLCFYHFPQFWWEAGLQSSSHIVMQEVDLNI